MGSDARVVVKSCLVACFALLVFGFSLAVSAQTHPFTMPGERFRECPECPEMVVVPAGKFLMGSSDADLARAKAAVDNILFRWTFSSRLGQEQPQHEVTLRHPFALGRYAVTRGEFAAFVRATGYQPEPSCTPFGDRRYRFNTHAGWLNPGFAQGDRDPVVCVSIADAEAYIAWLNKHAAGSEPSSRLGPYRLPTEAEWEYSARAGTTTARWWGDEIGVGNAVCDMCGTRWDDQRTAPVEAFPGNPFGVSGMLGNAFQWTADCWNPDYRSAPMDGSRRATGDCSEHVIRGGSIHTDPEFVRSANRSHESVAERDYFVGFRIARTLSVAVETK